MLLLLSYIFNIVGGRRGISGGIVSSHHHGIYLAITCHDGGVLSLVDGSIFLGRREGVSRDVPSLLVCWIFLFGFID
jgi:hypothetical protein